MDTFDFVRWDDNEKLTAFSQPIRGLALELIHFIIIFGNKSFSIKKWDDSCLLSFWSIWKQFEPRHRGILLIIPLPFSEYQNDFQLRRLFKSASKSFPPWRGQPSSSPPNVHFNFKNHLNLWNKCLMGPYYAPKTVRGYLDTSVSKTEMHPCCLQLPFYGIIQDLGSKQEIPWLAGSGSEWAPYTSGHVCFPSENVENWTETQMTWMSPTDPMLVTLSVPYVNQSALFSVSCLKLPETFSLTTNDTHPLSSELSPRITPLKSFQITPSAIKPEGVHGSRSTLRDSSARASGRRHWFSLNKRGNKLGKERSTLFGYLVSHGLDVLLSEGYSAEGSSVDSSGDGRGLCGANWQHS